MRPLFWQQIVISSSCTNNMPFWCWPRSWAYYTVWLWAMLLMFHRYKLTPVSWSKCVRLLNFSVYNMYVEVWKRWGGGDDRRVGVGSIICTKRYSKLGKLCNQHFQGLQSAAENNWQLMFPSNHQTKYSSPPTKLWNTTPYIYTEIHSLYVHWPWRWRQCIPPNISNTPMSTWCNNPTTKFTSTVNHCENLRSVTCQFLIQCFQLSGCGFYMHITYEKEDKKK